MQQVTYRGFQTQSRDFSVYDSHQVVDGRDVGNPMLDIVDIDSLHPMQHMHFDSVRRAVRESQVERLPLSVRVYMSESFPS